MYPFNTTFSFDDPFGRLIHGSEERTSQISTDDTLATTESSDEFLFSSLHERQIQPFTLDNALTTTWDLSDDLRPYVEYVLSELDNAIAPDITITTPSAESIPYAQIESVETHLHTKPKPDRNSGFCNAASHDIGGAGLTEISTVSNWTGYREKQHKCDKCEKSYACLRSLIRHRHTHRGEKPHQCDKCQKSFTYSSHLIRHKRSHSVKKLHQCDKCQKTFTQLSSLKEHNHTHSGEKPYQCDKCEMKFKLSANLIRHQHTHTGEKPYQCDECQKKFSHPFSLTRHKRTHTGEKPYPCDKCQKSFADKSNLKQHQRIHAGEKASSV